LAFGIGDILGRLFGSASSQRGKKVDRFTDPVTHGDYTIHPESFQNSGHWITAARISRQFSDGARDHNLIRADMFPTEGTANECAIRKAILLIDETGEKLFGGD